MMWGSATPVLTRGLLPWPSPVGLPRYVLDADGAPADVCQMGPLQRALCVLDRVILCTRHPGFVWLCALHVVMTLTPNIANVLSCCTELVVLCWSIPHAEHGWVLMQGMSWLAV